MKTVSTFMAILLTTSILLLYNDVVVWHDINQWGTYLLLPPTICSFLLVVDSQLVVRDASWVKWFVAGCIVSILWTTHPQTETIAQVLAACTGGAIAYYVSGKVRTAGRD